MANRGTFQVWAPAARRVDLVFEPGGAAVALQANARGYFTGSDERVRGGQLYRLYVDGQGPFPDPRSAWQPQGVHGVSCFFDFDSVLWSDAGFAQCPLEAAVIYELHVGTFSKQGTFEAVIGRLPYLKDLGITHLELMPVAHFPGERGWGYDGVCLFAPHVAYGGPQGLLALVDACHQQGIAVILDVVYNHLGPSGNYLGRFGPYFTHKYHTPWGAAFNFDEAGSDEVRRFICDNAKHWLRHYHIDGLRLDATHAIFDQSARSILAQLTEEVSELSVELGRPLLVIAEHCLNDPKAVRSRELGGYGMSSQWSDDFHNALHVTFTQERAGYYKDYQSLSDVARALKQGFVYQGQYCPSRDRAFGASSTGLLGRHFVVFSQNHDQVGNRAQGDRLSMLVSHGQLKLAAALLLLSPFVPLLFMGEEWGSQRPFLFFVEHEDPALNQAVKKGRLKEFADFGWQPQEVPDPAAPDTFLSSQLDWSRLDSIAGQDLSSWYRQLIALRKEHFGGEQTLAEVQVECDEAQGWLSMKRGALRVCAYFGGARHRVFTRQQRVLLGTGRSHEEEGVYVLDGPGVVVFDAA